MQKVGEAICRALDNGVDLEPDRPFMYRVLYTPPFILPWKPQPKKEIADLAFIYSSVFDELVYIGHINFKYEP